MDLKSFTASSLELVRKNALLVHNITNFVVMNSTANILLAMGASPVMAHAPDEVEDMARLSSALVLNIGTLDRPWIDAMILAGKAANSKGIPVILDPVGAGATRFRTESSRRILSECRVDVVRGNASEVLALWDSTVSTRGVESSLSLSGQAADDVARIARENSLVLAISGEVDLVTDGKETFLIRNGHALMTRVTGMGCGLSAVTGAFCAANPDHPARSAAAAFGFYGLCGEKAAAVSEKPGSFFTAFLDQLYSTGPDHIRTSVRIEGPLS